MSKFKPLPTDNSNTGPQEDSIFYRSQSTITDQYKNARIEQQEKQQRLLSAVNPPNSNTNNNNHNTNNINPRLRRTKLKPAKRIALGGSRNKNRPTSLTSNKPSTKAQSQLLRNYKKEYSRAQYDNFKKDELPTGTLKCSLFKKSLACNRAYIGHFVGSKGPRFPRSRIKAIREDDLQTKLERIQYDKSLNAKKRDEIIAKLKFGLADENESRYIQNGREWWFDFQEEPKPNNNTNNNEKEEDVRRDWLGKPKQKDKNYSYVIMEWTGTTRTATVYPATFIEFGLSTQLVAEGQASAESAEKRHRQQLAKWRKKQAEKSMMEKLGNLFGHDEHGNIKTRKKKLRADEITDEAKHKLTEMYMDKTNITNEEMEMLGDLLGDESYNIFMTQYKEHHNTKGTSSLQTGDDSSKSLITDKVLSKRLKSNKRRGQLDELGDFDEFMSDDEDENNLNNYDLVDDGEEDVLSDLDGDESENDELFRKLEKNIGEDLANKEYELPEKEVKNGLFDKDSDDDGDEDIAWTISDDEDEEQDMDGNVTIKPSVKGKNVKKNKKNKGNPPNTNGDGKNGKNGNSKKRRLDGGGTKGKGKGGPSRKRRRLNAVDEQKLKEELTILITKILKKFPDGLEMLDLWRKITATLSAEQAVIKKVLPPVLKTLAKQKDINGKKKYCLKDKYK